MDRNTQAVLQYRCAIDRLCNHYSLLPGAIEPNGTVRADPRVLDGAQSNMCSNTAYYRQELDARRGGNC